MSPLRGYEVFSRLMGYVEAGVDGGLSIGGLSMGCASMDCVSMGGVLMGGISMGVAHR